MATATETAKIYRLRTSPSELQIDRKAGTISNAAVMTAGPAEGHGFVIDRQTLDQLLGAAAKQTPMRWTHTAPWDDALGQHVGHVENLSRTSPDQIRGTIRFGPHAQHVPGKGDVTSYLMDLAEYDPTAFGLSVAVRATTEQVGEDYALRISELLSIDLVDSPAANPTGLLSTTTSECALHADRPIGSDRRTAMATSTSDTQAAAPVDPNAAGPAPTDTPDVLALEAKRVGEITKLAGLYALDDVWAAHEIASGSTIDQAVASARKALAERQPPPRADVHVGQDRARAAGSAILPDAILLHAGVQLKDPHPRARDLAGHSLVDILRHGLRMIGVPDAFDLSRNAVIDMLNPSRLRNRYPVFLAQSTSDFDNILVNALTKSLAQAYGLAPSTWQIWARRGSIPDFKAANRVILSDAPVLVQKAEGAETKYYNLTDHKETITLVTYASGIKLTREAIINDDLNAFDRIPTMQATAARQKEDDVAYAILTDNGTMGSPSAALFSSTHANLVSATASVGAPTVALIATTAGYLMKQTSLKGAYLNLMPRFMLTPTELYYTAKQLVASAVDPAKYNNTPNPFQDLIVVGNARLSANSAYKWYLLADSAMIDTIEVAFLADEPAPVVKQETDFATDDQRFAVRHTVAAGALDYRGMVQNNGTV